VRVSAGDEIGELRPFAEASFGPLDDPRSVHRCLSAVARKAKVAMVQPLVATSSVEFVHIVSFVVLPCGGNRPRHQTVAPAVPRLNPGAVCCGPSRPAPRRRPVARGPAPLAPPRRGPHRAPRPPTSSCGSAPARAQPPANAEKPEPACHRTGEGRYAPQQTRFPERKSVSTEETNIPPFRYPYTVVYGVIHKPPVVCGGTFGYEDATPHACGYKPPTWADIKSPNI
jgi:hypothetical protein